MQSTDMKYGSIVVMCVCLTSCMSVYRLRPKAFHFIIFVFEMLGKFVFSLTDFEFDFDFDDTRFRSFQSQDHWLDLDLAWLYAFDDRSDFVDKKNSESVQRKGCAWSSSVLSVTNLLVCENHSLFCFIACFVSGHRRRRNVTTSMVGTKTATYAKISPNGEPLRYSWGIQKKKKHQDILISDLVIDSTLNGIERIFFLFFLLSEILSDK